MAKRRKLKAPSPDALREIEAELSHSPRRMGVAPIAQVAAEAAALTQPGDLAARADAARLTAEAERLRAAEAEGRLVTALPVDAVGQGPLTRDRLALDPEALDELKRSVAASGVRLPIEVSRAADGSHALISGFRRLAAVRALRSETGDPRWDTIPALIHDAPDALGPAYVAMVEENEIRADLSAYERGRIAVLAAGEGAFDSVEAAVDALFRHASKAKRSKVRSFAAVHEALGDLLRHPTALAERQGLQLATALRAGFGEALREALAAEPADTPEAEWAALKPVLDAAEAARATRRQTGRPRSGSRHRPPAFDPREVPLANGMSCRVEHGAEGYAIRFKGRMVDRELMETVMLEIQRLLAED